MAALDQQKSYAKKLIRDEVEARRALPHVINDWLTKHPNDEVTKAIEELGLKPENAAAASYTQLGAFYDRIEKLNEDPRVFKEEKRILKDILHGNLSSGESPHPDLPMVARWRERIARDLPEGMNYEQFIQEMRRETAADTLKFAEVSAAIKEHFIEQMKFRNEAEEIVGRLSKAVYKQHDNYGPLEGVRPESYVRNLGALEMNKEYWKDEIQKFQSLKLDGDGKKAVEEFEVIINRGALISEKGHQLNGEFEILSNGSRRAMQQMSKIEEGAREEYNAFLATAKSAANAEALKAAETAANPILSDVVQTEERIAKEAGGKAKWIIGSIVAATVALGAIVWHGNKKKSFAEQETERRQKPNDMDLSASRA